MPLLRELLCYAIFGHSDSMPWFDARMLEHAHSLSDSMPLRPLRLQVDACGVGLVDSIQHPHDRWTRVE